MGIIWNENVALSSSRVLEELKGGRGEGGMACPLKVGGQCPLCRENGREGRLELRQINASEALWICGNLQVSEIPRILEFNSHVIFIFSLVSVPRVFRRINGL